MLGLFDVSLYSTAFLITLLGSGHCFGMCGGIAGMAGVEKAPLFHLGRLTGYLGWGAFYGLFGSALLGFFSMHRLLILVWVLLMTVFLVWQAIQIWNGSMDSSFVIKKYRNFYSNLTGGVLKKLMHSQGAFQLGLVSAFLPCGLMIPFAIAATSSGSPVKGILIYSMVWLGSLPALLAAASFGLLIRQKLSLLKSGKIVQKVLVMIVLSLSVLSVLSKSEHLSHYGAITATTTTEPIICGSTQ